MNFSLTRRFHLRHILKYKLDYVFTDVICPISSLIIHCFFILNAKGFFLYFVWASFLSCVACYSDDIQL